MYPLVYVKSAEEVKIVACAWMFIWFICFAHSHAAELCLLCHRFLFPAMTMDYFCKQVLYPLLNWLFKFHLKKEARWQFSIICCYWQPPTLNWEIFSFFFYWLKSLLPFHNVPVLWLVGTWHFQFLVRSANCLAYSSRRIILLLFFFAQLHRLSPYTLAD